MNRMATIFTLVALLFFLTNPVFDSLSLKICIPAFTGKAFAEDNIESATYNPRVEFRRLGWEVYDEPGLKNRPKRDYQYKIDSDFKDKINSVTDIFTADELRVIQPLIDGNPSNDELKFIFVTTDNFLTFTLISLDKDIGKEGIYTALKKLTKEQADRVRKSSPDFGK
jgi:hypothetical protein